MTPMVKISSTVTIVYLQLVSTGHATVGANPVSGLYAESEALCEIWANRRTQAQVRR
jgi:hypothetical protein